MKKMHPIAWAILCLPVVYFAMVTASVYIPGENIFALLERISTIVRRPDLLRWTAYTSRFLLVFLLFYGGGVLLYYADHENRRPGEEYGSAKWGNARELNKQYADRDGKNVILTKRVSIGLDGYKHRRNLNILVVGGSGSGKTRFFCKPGIMSVNCSYLIVDPKGEMLRSIGLCIAMIRVWPRRERIPSSSTARHPPPTIRIFCAASAASLPWRLSSRKRPPSSLAAPPRMPRSATNPTWK